MKDFVSGVQLSHVVQAHFHVKYCYYLVTQQRQFSVFTKYLGSLKGNRCKTNNEEESTRNKVKKNKKLEKL